MIEPTIEPDTKDWTWVLREPCTECGFVATHLAREDLGRLLRVDATGWAAVLRQPNAGERPDAQTWSPLEYACHVRDVHRVFGERVQMMLAVDDPLFENWDQDVAAVQGAYRDQDPAAVATELVDAAAKVSRSYAGIEGPQWDRPGRRSNGSLFTVDSLSRYHLHDVEHHLHDVS